MRANYDLKKLKWKPNPYVKLLKKPITIRVDEDVLNYFKALGHKERIPYQTVINQFLRFCKQHKMKPQTSFVK
jgi:uncharacterized protein (DUF4415 family)